MPRGKERSQFTGLANKLSSVPFLLNLGLMFDALEELKDLSEALQATDITVYRAVRMISQQIEVFVYRKSEGGTAYSAVQNAVADGTFEGVTLVKTCRGSAKIGYNFINPCLIPCSPECYLIQKNPLCRLQIQFCQVFGEIQLLQSMENPS